MKKKNIIKYIEKFEQFKSLADTNASYEPIENFWKWWVCGCWKIYREGEYNVCTPVASIRVWGWWWWGITKRMKRGSKRDRAATRMIRTRAPGIKIYMDKVGGEVGEEKSREKTLQTVKEGRCWPTRTDNALNHQYTSCPRLANSNIIFKNSILKKFF